jgi:hypothetical protein
MRQPIFAANIVLSGTMPSVGREFFYENDNVSLCHGFLDFNNVNSFISPKQ